MFKAGFAELVLQDVQLDETKLHVRQVVAHARQVCKPPS